MENRRNFVKDNLGKRHIEKHIKTIQRKIVQKSEEKAYERRRKDNAVEFNHQILNYS